MSIRISPTYPIEVSRKHLLQKLIAGQTIKVDADTLLKLAQKGFISRNDFNRRLSGNNLKRIEELFAKHGSLEHFPVILLIEDGKLIVVIGHHRMEVALRKGYDLWVRACESRAEAEVLSKIESECLIKWPYEDRLISAAREGNVVCREVMSHALKNNMSVTVVGQALGIRYKDIDGVTV